MQPGHESRQARPRPATGALLGLCTLEAALFLVGVGWQKAGSMGAIFRGGTATGAFLAGAALAVPACAALWWIYRSGSGTDRTGLAQAAVVNLLGLIIALGCAEMLLRLGARPSGAGLVVGPVILPPTWDEIRSRNSMILATRAGFRDEWLQYMVSDPLLGWSVGPDRRTPDGMYFSSVEGLRSGGPGIRFADRRPRLRIALVGDSFTFAMDGPFEDSWGYQLEQMLGTDVQVLNFGVDGYGIDQAWLRYRRDVGPWNPDIVLFGLIQHDLKRTLAVYPFITFGWDYPYAKPRFVPAGDSVRLLNAPLVTPQAILDYPDPASLPFVELDLGYRQADWSWRRGNPPLLARLFGVAFRRWHTDMPEVSDATSVEISGRILRMFSEATARSGTAARIIYFPSEGAGDFGKPVPASDRIARAMLAHDAPDHLDLTACVVAVPPELRIVPGGNHYSRLSNGKVAECVAADLERRGWLR